MTVFQNLLSCLDVDIDKAELNECLKKQGLTYQGTSYVKYEQVVRMMHYDNHIERWGIKNRLDEPDTTLSVINEKTKGNAKHIAVR